MEAKTYCWICKRVADSAEHRIKKSDLVNLYGSGPYKGENAVVLIRAEQEIPVQGPNSKLVKYKKNLCSKCNNEFSQPFDKAYERFITYIRQNKDLIIKRRLIDFQDVYGDEFEISQCNLYKYFVKSLGCRLSHDNYPIPEDLPTLLPKRSFRTQLRITFSVSEDFLLLPANIRTAGKGKLMTFLPLQETRPTWLEKGRTRPLEYQWSESFEWLYVWYWYNTLPNGKLGSTWIADSRYVYLGSYEALSDEERQKFLEQSSDSKGTTTETPAV